jgi:hypothetical protein
MTVKTDPPMLPVPEGSVIEGIWSTTKEASEDHFLLAK